VQLVGETILNPPAERGGLSAIGRRTRTPEETAVLEKGRTIYTEVCFACHGTDGRGTPMAGAGPGVTMAPPLASSPRVLGHRDYVIQVLLHGLTGPINGEQYSEVMIPMGENPDDWVAAIGSYVRNAFGNTGAMITPADVARVRAATASRRTSPTVDQIQSSLPHLLVVDNGWKVTASHNAATAPNALTIQPWSTGVRQAAGMWLQVELPRAVQLAEVEFESAPTEDPAAAAQTAAQGSVLGAPPRTGGGPTGPLGYPRAYQVQVSTDGSTWSAPVAQGQGAGADTVIAFAPVSARFVRITQTGTAADAPPWNVQRLRLYEAPAQ
jgi:mono/diheme cytochrome c family protein